MLSQKVKISYLVTSSFPGPSSIYDENCKVEYQPFDGFEELGTFIMKKPEDRNRPSVDLDFYKPNEYHKIPVNETLKQKLKSHPFFKHLQKTE